MKNREFIRFNRIVFHCKKEPNYIEAIARDQFGVFNSMLTAITSKICIRKSFLFLFCWWSSSSMLLLPASNILVHCLMSKIIFFSVTFTLTADITHIGYILCLPLPPMNPNPSIFTWNQLSLFWRCNWNKWKKHVCTLYVGREIVYRSRGGNGDTYFHFHCGE